jgi:hypothetical protein
MLSRYGSGSGVDRDPVKVADGDATAERYIARHSKPFAE